MLSALEHRRKVMDNGNAKAERSVSASPSWRTCATWPTRPVRESLTLQFLENLRYLAHMPVRSAPTLPASCLGFPDRMSWRADTAPVICHSAYPH